MKRRLVTGVTAGAAFLFVLYVGGLWFELLILLLALIGLYEFQRMNGVRSLPIAAVSYGALVLLVMAPGRGGEAAWSHVGGGLPGVPAVLWLAMVLLFSATVFTKNRVTLDTVGLQLLGVLYIGVGFRFMIVARESGDAGLWWTILIFACIWASDSGAYFTGKAVGRRKLWPAISPNKTVEGAFGGVLAASVTAALIAAFRPELIPVGQATALGAAIAVVGQLGDLIQSAYKRVRNIKDTGAILPGHGGVLDRTDSWLIVFPFVHLLSCMTHMTQ